MEKQSPIQTKANLAIKSLESIEDVSVSPFFKEKTLNKLFRSSEAIKISFMERYFTPQLQFVGLLIIVLLNGYAFYNYNSQQYDTGINKFSETFDLKVNQTTIFK
jgi:hypothetical protein